MEITPNAKRALIAFALLSVTLFFRLYRLSDIPLGVNNDAIWESLAARSILQGNWKDYIPYAAAWHGEPTIRILVAALSPYFGDTTTTVKLASSVFGILLIPGLYRLLRIHFSETLALITTWLVATSGWHIIMSRSGWRAIMAPTVTTFFLLTLSWAWLSGKKAWYIASGIALGATLYSYDAARVIPLIVIPILSLTLLSRTLGKNHLSGVIYLLVTFFIVILPMIVYASSHWDFFAGRSGYLFVGNKILQEHSFAPLWKNVFDTALLFTYRAHGNDFFIDEPLLDPPAIWLFPIGLVIAIWHVLAKKTWTYGWMIIWFLATLIPALISEPNGNRAIGAIPSVYFFAGLAAVTLASFAAHIVRTYASFIRIFLLSYIICASFLTTYISYIGPLRKQPKGLYPETYVVASYLKTKIQTHDIYIVDNFPREILTYILYEGGDPFEPTTYTWFSENKHMLDVKQKKHRGLIFVFAPIEINAPLIQSVLAQYPQAKKTPISYTTDSTSGDAAIIVEVDP
jgi:hypothetical protein